MSKSGRVSAFYDRSVVYGENYMNGAIQYCKWGETLGIGVGHLPPEDRADVSQDMFTHSNILDNPNPAVTIDSIRPSSGFFAMANFHPMQILENDYSNLTILMIEQYNEGQWGFPMGGVEEEDANLLDTAIREWDEETGRQLPLESSLCSYSREYSDTIHMEPFRRFKNQVSKPYQSVALGKSLLDNLYRWTYYRNTVAGPKKMKCVNLIPLITDYPSDMDCMEALKNPSTHSPEILQSAWVPYYEVLERVCDVDRAVLRHGMNDLAYGLKVAYHKSARDYLKPFRKRPDQTTTNGRIRNMFEKFGMAPESSNLSALADKIYEADQKSENDRIEDCLTEEES